MLLNKKRLAFIIPSADLGGGIYIVFEHAVRLTRRGHFEIYLVIDKKPNKEDLRWYPDANELEWLNFFEAEKIVFDAVISTWWLTCYQAYRLNSKAYIYFNQSVESKFYKPENILDRKYAESTYFLSMKVITEATWIKEYLDCNYGICAELVLNGIRKDVFTLDGLAVASRAPSRLRVLIEGPLGIHFKNTEKAIELSLRSDADEVWLLTTSDIDKYKGVDRVFSQVPIFETPTIYRSCDVIVKLSYVEGMFGPPLEMFHCGGTAIVYDVTGHDEYIKNNYNAYVVETDDENKVIELINKLKEDPDELLRLKRGAVETAANWYDWEAASVEFEKALERLCEAKHIGQAQLKNKTIHFKDWYEYYNFIHWQIRGYRGIKKLFKEFIKQIIAFIVR